MVGTTGGELLSIYYDKSEETLVEAFFDIDCEVAMSKVRAVPHCMRTQIRMRAHKHTRNPKLRHLKNWQDNKIKKE